LSSPAAYKILVENRALTGCEPALTGWERLAAEHPEQMKELKDFLHHSPTNLKATAGKAKKLRGPLEGYYQYDVTWSARVRYQVDKKSFKVYVAYAGAHP
jgi:hypothetical protein